LRQFVKLRTVKFERDIGLLAAVGPGLIAIGAQRGLNGIAEPAQDAINVQAGDRFQRRFNLIRNSALTLAWLNVNDLLPGNIPKAVIRKSGIPISNGPLQISLFMLPINLNLLVSFTRNCNLALGKEKPKA